MFGPPPRRSFRGHIINLGISSTGRAGIYCDRAQNRICSQALRPCPEFLIITVNFTMKIVLNNFTRKKAVRLDSLRRQRRFLSRLVFFICCDLFSCTFNSVRFNVWEVEDEVINGVQDFSKLCTFDRKLVPTTANHPTRPLLHFYCKPSSSSSSTHDVTLHTDPSVHGLVIVMVQNNSWVSDSYACAIFIYHPSSWVSEGITDQPLRDSVLGVVCWLVG